MLPFALATLAVQSLAPAPNLFIFFLQVFAVLPLAVLGYWYGSFQPEQRKAFLEALAWRFPRLSHVAAGATATLWLTRHVLGDR